MFFGMFNKSYNQLLLKVIICLTQRCNICNEIGEGWYSTNYSAIVVRIVDKYKFRRHTKINITDNDKHPDKANIS